MREKLIRLFIKTTAPKVKVTFNPLDECHYRHIDEVVNINLSQASNEDDGGFRHHLALAHKCHFVNEISLPLWSILHELGHHFTADDIDLDDKLDLFEQREQLFAMQEHLTDEEMNNAYFNLADEWEATEWAVEYVRKHPIKCLIFGDLLR